MTKHTDQCNEWHKQYEEWLAKWPNYCKKCGAWGSWSTPGTRLDPPDAGACVCVEAGVCPRCASLNTRLIDIKHCDYLYCNDCGWDESVLLFDLVHEQKPEMTIPEWECHEWTINDLVYGECTPEFLEYERKMNG